MIFNITGGGGTSLNFRVVGDTTEPTNPKENTIWVNTDQKITGWVFSATEPEAPVEGMVWISTGSTSSAEFNALKKNGIRVYPISAKQYVSGAWADVEAKSYQNGEWVGWIIYLYNNGDHCTELTGGWSAQKAVAGATSSPPKLTDNGDSLTITHSSSTANSGNLTTYNAVDLTSIKTIYFNFSQHSGNGFTRIEAAPESAGLVSEAPAVSHYNITKAGEYSIDVSALTGKYRIRIYSYTDAGATMSFTVKEVRMK